MALVIARKVGERIRLRVGNSVVWVEVNRVNVRSGRANLAFQAGPEVEIVRGELLEGGRIGTSGRRGGNLPALT
jgi:sRNA-binding carbon storage regulator CsrA